MAGLVLAGPGVLLASAGLIAGAPPAAAQQSSETVHACVLVLVGVVRIVDSPSACLPLLEQAVQWPATTGQADFGRGDNGRDAGRTGYARYRGH